MLDQAKTKAATSVEDEDKSPCFSETPVETYYEAPLPESKRRIDKEAWMKRLSEISAVFKSTPEILEGTASLNFEVQRTYFVNTDGSEVVQNRVAARLMLSASTMADDGMHLPLNKDYFAYDPQDLPSNEVIIADVKDMVKRLMALREAPVSDPYTGPAILSGPASGVFFHEIFGHRLEGHRLKTGGQTFKKMVGEMILPADFQVYSDPTLRSYVNTDLNGSYVYDNEGVKARRVDNVVNGVLTEFLMNRVPIDGFPVSNGHGRATEGADPVSRQSNLMIETTHPYTEDELRAMLVEEAKKQEKEYGYYFKSVTSGFTYTGEGGSLNSFNVTPLEVYRVFVDGRPDQLVRGVDLIGTPLSMFSNIAAGGNDPSVFTGSCGAESGWVPVTACSPTIYVSKIETQRRAQSRDIPPILPAPEVTNKKGGDADEVIFQAMNDELKRSMEQLVLPNESKPFYMSTSTASMRQIYITGVLGGIQQSVVTPWSSKGSIQLAIGDYTSTSEIESGQSGTIQLPAEADYDALRRTYWMGSDQMYRHAVNSQAQKKTYLNSNPPSPELASVPDMQKLPAVTKFVERDREFVIDKEALEKLVSEVSAVFSEYNEIYDSNVTLDGVEANIYRLTSEDVKLKLPEGFIRLRVSAKIRTTDEASTPIGNSFNVTVANTADLPSIEELKKRAHHLADILMKEKEAAFVDEYYNGPVMFEGEGVAFNFVQELLRPGTLVAYKSPLGQPAQTLDDRLGRRVIDTRISIKERPSLKSYKDIALMGSCEIDADGVAPAERTLIDRGVFKEMLNGRYPTLKAPTSTGNAKFQFSGRKIEPFTTPNVIHVQIEKGLKANKMKSALLKEAKKEGLEHAYIVRFMEGGESLQLYRVDVKGGKETLVRTTKLDLPKLDQLEKKLKEVSSDENVLNFLYNGTPASIIYPSAIIVEDLEILKATPKAEKAPVIANPLLRK